MLNIVIGILIIIGAVISVLISVEKTPQNLKGFYSKFYWFIAVLAIVAGIYVTVTGIIQVQ